jgi:hypothetical protein
MAKEIITRLRDDIDGSDASKTVVFGWDGVQYELDLSNKNATAFGKLLEPYVTAARRTGGRQVRRATATAKPTTRKRASKSAASDPATVREWATQNGFTVSPRGRISAAILEAYQGASA